jgi:hypothetical protein
MFSFPLAVFSPLEEFAPDNTSQTIQATHLSFAQIQQANMAFPHSGFDVPAIVRKFMVAKNFR